MRTFTAPGEMTPQLPRPWLFLCRAIERAVGSSWRIQVIRDLHDGPGTILNPVREDWDASWGTDLDDPRFRDQVSWELDALERSDAIVCWLPAGSLAAVSLLETGLHAARGKVVIGCPAGFHLRGNVRAVCQRYQLTHCEHLGDAVAAVRTMLGFSGGRQEPACSTPS